MQLTRSLVDGGGFYFGTALGYPGDGPVNASIALVSRYMEKPPISILNIAQNQPVIYIGVNYRTGIFGCEQYRVNSLDLV
jgi:hypothetical protein